jgi:hemerythrin
MEEIFIWDDTFKIGIEYFDNQHKKLIILANELSRIRNSSESNSDIEKIISELVEYVKTHFSEEENAMLKNNYGSYWQHKKEHEDFMIKIGKMRKRFNEGENISDELFIFIRDWITNHIKKTDKLYGPYLVK